MKEEKEEELANRAVKENKKKEVEGCLVGKREGNRGLVFRKKKRVAFSC